MVPIRALVRAATRLQVIWENKRHCWQREQRATLERLRQCQEKLETTRCRIEQIQTRGMVFAMAVLQEDLLVQVRAVQEAALQARHWLEPPEQVVPDLTYWISEIHQLEDEFGATQIDGKTKTLTVTTEPITLAEIYLGPFAIRLHWDRLAQFADSQCFAIVALDPHPSAPNEAVTHPHVSHEGLCPGEATLPIRKALAQGRLADAFCLVRGVLEHFNPHSPHVHLDEWEGTECHDCGSTVSEDDLYFCEGCDQDYCSDCSSCCVACDVTRCRGCLTSCSVCDEGCCSRCLKQSAHSDRDCCPRCIAVCSACRAEVAKDELTADDSVCPDCLESDSPGDDVEETDPDPSTDQLTQETPHDSQQPRPHVS